MRGTARRDFDRRYTVRANHEVLMEIYERTIDPGFKGQWTEDKRIGKEIRNRG
jgi:hypothetical protein